MYSGFVNFFPPNKYQGYKFRAEAIGDMEKLMACVGH